MELSLIKFIRENGLEAAVEKFQLTVRDGGHKILLKYSQIDSPMSFSETQDARGLIIEKESLRVMCLPFRKFFNAGEGHAATVDWNTARILEKVDGSLLTVYYDRFIDEWCVSTTGTLEADGEVNNKLGTTFAQLFWETIGKIPGKFHGVGNMSAVERTIHLNQFLCIELCYAFELTTPYNIVVKPHGTSSVTLLTVRDVNTLGELSYDELTSLGIELDVPVVKAFDINALSVDELNSTFEGMPWSEEGYVVVDADFNRIKIKNPAYVAVHHLKGSTAEHNIMEIIKTNEVDEFASTFPERKMEIYMLMNKFAALRLNLELLEDQLKSYLPTDINDKEQIKNHALKVKEYAADWNFSQFSGLYFMLRSGKVATVAEFLRTYDNKQLYTLLKETK